MGKDRLALLPRASLTRLKLTALRLALLRVQQNARAARMTHKLPSTAPTAIPTRSFAASVAGLFVGLGSRVLELNGELDEYLGVE